MTSRHYRIAIVSDIHYASAAEQARGDDYEIRAVRHPLLRLVLRLHRRFIWMRHPLRQNHLLDQFIERAGGVDFVIANGDYSCNSGFVGVSDNAACESAGECLGKLRSRFGDQLRLTLGDHELGKLSFMGGAGGMRLASWQRALNELNLQPFWQLQLGSYVLAGIASSLVALPLFEPDTLPSERPEWTALRDEHMKLIRAAFDSLETHQKVILFCHDPTALPFLSRDDVVRSKLPQVERTIIGHLHSNAVLWKSRLLAGMPPIRFLGHTVKRLSGALNEARCWRAFHVSLCPALAGIELLKDGGFCTLDLDGNGGEPTRFQFHRISR